MIAITSKPPYYAVIFTSIRTETDEGYEKMAERMIELAQQQKGFLGVESARSDIGITVSYWDSLESISNWKHNLEHTKAREKGRKLWYKKFTVRICKVERTYDFEMEL